MRGVSNLPWLPLQEPHQHRSNSSFCGGGAFYPSPAAVFWGGPSLAVSLAPTSSILTALMSMYKFCVHVIFQVQHGPESRLLNLRDYGRPLVFHHYISLPQIQD